MHQCPLYRTSTQIKYFFLGVFHYTKVVRSAANIISIITSYISVTDITLSMLNAMTISDMSIVIFIIKHPTFSGRNVMLRYVSDRIDGGGGGRLCMGDRRGLPGLCFFSRKPMLYRRGRGRIGGCFSAAAGQPHHSITLVRNPCVHGLN